MICAGPLKNSILDCGSCGVLAVDQSHAEVSCRGHWVHRVLHKVKEANGGRGTGGEAVDDCSVSLSCRKEVLEERMVIAKRIELRGAQVKHPVAVCVSNVVALALLNVDDVHHLGRILVEIEVILGEPEQRGGPIDGAHSGSAGLLNSRSLPSIQVYLWVFRKRGPNLGFSNEHFEHFYVSMQIYIYYIPC